MLAALGFSFAVAWGAAPGDAFPEGVAVPGRVTVVNVWATWCGPCRAELPLLDALHARLAAAGVGAVVGLNVDHGRTRAAALSEKLGLGLIVRYDDEGAVAAVLAPDKLPTTYVVGADGTLRHVHDGALDERGIATVEAEARALAESPR